MLTDIYVRYLHNDAIKPFDNGGLDSVVDSQQKIVLIGDKTLMSFIPL